MNHHYYIYHFYHFLKNLVEYSVIFIFLMILLIFIFIYFKFNFLFRIKVKIIELKPPICHDNNSYVRLIKSSNSKDTLWLSKEENLRKNAYLQTPLKLNEHFYDDSDMHHNYKLIIVYDNFTKDLLLSSRCYSDVNTIKHHILDSQYTEIYHINFESFKNDDILLIDRLCGNVKHHLYRSYPNYINAMLYKSIFLANQRTKAFFAMAREGRGEKLLKKYIILGFDIIGKCTYQNLNHWVLSTNLEKSYQLMLQQFFINIVFVIKNKFKRI